MNINALASRAVFALAAAVPGIAVSDARPADATAPPSGSTEPVSYVSADVLKLAERVADHQLQRYADGHAKAGLPLESFKETGWVQGAFFVGLRDLADRSSNPKYKAAILARGQLNGYKPASRIYHADDQVIGQAYLWAAANGAGPEAIVPLRARFDQILAAPPSDVGLDHGERGDPTTPDCRKRWCWSDALFMAPPAWVELSRLTGDQRYADYAKREFLAVTAHLYDQKEHLFYRDSRFFDRRGPNGEKVFWSRGSGWVMAGLARLIPMLATDDPARAQMETVFRQIAARLVTLQKADGYWSPSLLADPASTRPETSGTGFFTYALAWGIKSGLLERAKFEPTVRKAWAALVRAVHPDGLLGYVQPVGDRPDNVSPGQTQFYGGGAFLLAAGAVADLQLAPGKDLTAPSPPYPQMVLNVRTVGQHYALKNRYTVPPEHLVGDGLIALEGLGWESDSAAYRLYLDERMAIDIFGKKVSGNVLHGVGVGRGDYHTMAPWGMDIFKVGASVGIGGLGRLRAGKVVSLGKSTISVTLDNTDAREASAEVLNTGLDGGKTDLARRLSIRSGSALTRVTAKTGASDGVPFVTGLTLHPRTTAVAASADANGWAYFATWGRQSLAKDNLGIAVFYRPDSVLAAPASDGVTQFVAFKDPAAIDYAFGVAWTQDRQGVGSLPQFRAWLDERRAELSRKQGQP